MIFYKTNLTIKATAENNLQRTIKQNKNLITLKL